MSKISSIKPQKRPNRFNIFLDDKFAFGVNADLIVEENLKVGKDLDEKTINRIIKKEDFTKLFDSSLKYLGIRTRSEKELWQYLAKKISRIQNIKFHEASQSLIIPRIVKKLKSIGYLDDLEFAKWLIASRNRQAKGSRIIKIELIKKGIAPEIIEKLTNNLPSQKDQAKKALEKKIKLWQKLPRQKFKEKVYRYLASRGFDWEDIKEAFAFFTKSG